MVTKIYIQGTVYGRDGETYEQLMARHDAALEAADLPFGGVISEIVPGSATDRATEPQPDDDPPPDEYREVPR